MTRNPRRVLWGLALVGAAAAIACGTSQPIGGDSSGGGTGGGGETNGGGNPVPGGSAAGGGAGQFPPGGVSFPWRVFDGSVPDVPPAAAPGRTFYVDAAHGDDALDGTAFVADGQAGPKKTLSAALAQVKAGDTILLGGGVYRERPSFDDLGGKEGAPITIGSYGHGTGAPILDGGLAPGKWTRYTAEGQTTVWQTSTAGLGKLSSSVPVLGIYVNAGERGELALREVAHGQLSQYADEPLPPRQTQSSIGDRSSKWYFDAAGKTLYADFGATLGDGDPNEAEISILYNSQQIGHEPLIVLPKGHGYFSFIGLTLRAGSWHGVYAQSGGNTFDHCDVKFNGGGGIFFDTGEGDGTITDNTVTYSRVWFNVLDNWPRFNNGNTGGGWPGALSWYSQSNALGMGNVVYGNGGEGLILWGTNSNGHVSTNNQIRNNVIFDNWSVNLYLDNTQNARIEQNFVFQHPRDPAQTFDGLLEISEGYSTDFGKRLTPVNLSLADEPGSAFDGQAHLSDITVINNIFAGGKFGFVDYDDGTSGVVHGLKSCLIANNTWVLGQAPIPGQSPYGWRHGFPDGNADASNNSLVQNNIIAVATQGDQLIDMGQAGAGTGITNDYNLYSGPGQFSSGGKSQDLTAWKKAHPTWDQHSLSGDAKLVDASEFSLTAAERPVYDWAKAALASDSPAFGVGANMVSRYNTDFTGATRAGGAFDLGAVGRR